MAYDADGNRTYSASGDSACTDLSAGNDTGSGTTYSYNADNELESVVPASGSSTTDGYNDDGELETSTTGSATTSYGYDVAGALISVVDGDSATATYTYDAAGERVESTVDEGGSSQTTPTIFDGGQPLEIYDGSDPTADDANPIIYTRGVGGELVDSTDGTSADTNYYYEDALGSTTALTDSNGDAADTYAYSAFGTVLNQTGSSTQPFGYLGNTEDVAQSIGGVSTDLDNFNAREYDPATGSFLSQDPVAGSASAPDTLDAYVYGGDNPFSNPDPTGMCFLGFGHDCPFSDALDSIQNAGNWLYNHPLATAGIAVAGVALGAAALICAAGPCELAGVVAGAAALVDAEATGVAADVAATGAEGLADAGVEGAADTVEGAGAPTVGVEDGSLGDAEAGQTVYRVWGASENQIESGARPWGQYWSRVDPRTVLDYRDVAGLPDENPGRFLSVGALLDTSTTEVTEGGAAALDGNVGGIDELKIINPEMYIELQQVIGLNPDF